VTLMHPACPNSAADCRITINSHSTSIITGVPIYDGFGRMVAALPDPNTYTTDYACRVCRAAWAIKQRPGQPDEVVTHTAPHAP